MLVFMKLKVGDIIKIKENGKLFFVLEEFKNAYKLCSLSSERYHLAKYNHYLYCTEDVYELYSTMFRKEDM